MKSKFEKRAIIWDTIEVSYSFISSNDSLFLKKKSSVE